jgi:hypothetical protein
MAQMNNSTTIFTLKSHSDLTKLRVIFAGHKIATLEAGNLYALWLKKLNHFIDQDADNERGFHCLC